MSVISLRPVDAASVTVLVDNFTDILLPPQGVAKRTPPRPNGPRVTAPLFAEGNTMAMPRAEHGFSALVTITMGEQVHRILFDTGVTPDGMIENMRLFELSPRDVEALVLSHGHWDHTAGLNGLVRELGTVNMPVTIHPNFWARRRLAFPGGEPLEIPSTSKGALRGAGFEIVEERQPSFLLDGALLVTGEVDRTTPFERGMPPAHQALKDGQWEHDPLVLDDQALLWQVRDRGLVILTGCGHSGIVNIVRYARKLTGIDCVYAIIGGFHLGGPFFEPIIEPTVDALAAFEAEAVVPAHCTGWRAIHRLAARIPDAFIQCSVGTRLEL